VTEYTPTTDEVRDYYAIGVDEALGRTSGESEFDRWLAEHDKEVLDKAVERIQESKPELSMAMYHHNFAGLDVPNDECDCCADVALHIVLAAIRGDGEHSETH